MQLEPVDPTVRFPWPSSNGSDHEIKLKLCPCLIIVRWFLSNHSQYHQEAEVGPTYMVYAGVVLHTVGLWIISQLVDVILFWNDAVF